MNASLLSALARTYTTGFPPQTTYANIDFEVSETTWAEYKEVMERLGGKYTSKKRGFAFAYDPAELIKQVWATKTLPARNPFAFFPTPREVVDQLIELIVADDERIGWPTFKNAPHRILEPSAGTGAISKRIKEVMDKGCVLEILELDPLNRAVLRKHFELGRELKEQPDFLQFVPAHPYDVIIMNPPFSVDSNPYVYIDHINHAMSMLDTGGKLAAVAPVGFTFRDDKKSVAFLRDVCNMGGWVELGGGAFKKSGTMANTVLIYMTKTEQSWRDKPYYEGFSCWHTGMLAMLDENNYEQCQELTKLFWGNFTDIQLYHHYMVTIKEARRTGTFIDLGDPNGEKWQEIYAYARRHILETR